MKCCGGTRAVEQMCKGKGSMRPLLGLQFLNRCKSAILIVQGEEMKKYRVVDITIPVFVPESICKGDRDHLVDWLNDKLYNNPEFFEGIIRDDVRVHTKTVLRAD